MNSILKFFSDNWQLLLIVLHISTVLISLIINLLTGKKVDKFCKDCGMPIYKNTEHNCTLTNEELKLLTDFIVKIKENHKDGE